jgi:hypothetical protein
MIPDIGLMIAAYIVTRMIELLSSNSTIVAKIFAVITILVAVIATADLLLGGVRVQPPLSR